MMWRPDGGRAPNRRFVALSLRHGPVSVPTLNVRTLPLKRMCAQSVRPLVKPTAVIRRGRFGRPRRGRIVTSRGLAVTGTEAVIAGFLRSVAAYVRRS